MKFFAIALVFTLSLLAMPSNVDGAEYASVHATLIQGSNRGGGVDSQLKLYEKHLARVFKFDTFRLEGGGKADVVMPSSGTISIGGGHEVSVNVSDAGNGRLRIAAKWTKSGRILITTTVVSSRNQPTVLGGPPAGDGKLILLLVAN